MTNVVLKVVPTMTRKLKKADSAENRSEQSQMLHILQNLPDPMFVTDRDGNVLLSNSESRTNLTYNVLPTAADIPDMER